MGEKIRATLNISVDVECPHCNGFVDLMSLSCMTDDGYIYNEVMSNGRSWGCDDFNEEITCPECKNKFTVNSVEY